MGLETGNYIADLNSSNPTGSDGKSAGDNHLRLIKSLLKNSFPGFSGPVVVAGTVGGTGDVVTITPATALVSYVSPMVLVFVPGATNTTAVTVNISALGAKALKSPAAADLSAGDLVSGEPVLAVYDGTYFRMLHPTKSYIDQLAFSTALPSQAGNAGKFVKTDGSTATWDQIDATDIASFSAGASAVRTGTSTTSALTPGDTYSALAEVTLTDAATIAVDMSTFINAVVTLGGNRTLGNPSNTKVGQTGRIRIIQDGTGSRTLAYSSNWKFTSGVAPVVSTAAGAVDFLEYEVVTSTFIRGRLSTGWA